ncbi:hypothetical protein Pyn_29428 [Prunus yedoensis var. nudiflora]|uniref:Uncharacterized protein n=1 Tax=Prunus yedoensis var. nudiflora TaxID=2094558 RepID=A0A314UQ19_PRUYE|nr:hypothetical protein Pyn_29428 [Prunus yedoensis var. nudiflora]
MESSTGYPFERLEKAMVEGFQTMTTSMTNSMNLMSQSIVQTVEKGHENTTLQGNETRAHLSQIFERIIRMAQEEDAPRKEKGLLENENTPSGVPRLLTRHSRPDAHWTNCYAASSPSKEPGGQRFTPSGTSSKYQAPRTGEPALPPGHVRKNMYAEKWKEPAGFNIAPNNGDMGVIDELDETMNEQSSSFKILTTTTRQDRTLRPLSNHLRHAIRMRPYEMK